MWLPFARRLLPSSRPPASVASHRCGSSPHLIQGRFSVVAFSFLPSPLSSLSPLYFSSLCFSSADAKPHCRHVCKCRQSRIARGETSPAPLTNPSFFAPPAHNPPCAAEQKPGEPHVQRLREPLAGAQRCVRNKAGERRKEERETHTHTHGRFRLRPPLFQQSTRTLFELWTQLRVCGRKRPTPEGCVRVCEKRKREEGRKPVTRALQQSLLCRAPQVRAGKTAGKRGGRCGCSSGGTENRAERRGIG